MPGRRGTRWSSSREKRWLSDRPDRQLWRYGIEAKLRGIQVPPLRWVADRCRPDRSRQAAPRPTRRHIFGLRLSAERPLFTQARRRRILGMIILSGVSSPLALRLHYLTKALPTVY